ncbi:MAG: hypothetical protein ACRELB_12250 [Polyangiaceae bacterium]
MPDPKRPLTEGRFSQSLFAAFLVVAFAFVGASVYANYLAFEIEGEADKLLSNALPSTQHLTAAIDHLRDLEAASDDYPDLPAVNRPAAQERIAELWKLIDDELGSYLALPTYPGERAEYAAVPASLRDLDASIHRLFADAESADPRPFPATAEHDVRVEANRAAGLLRTLVRLNTE